MLNKKDLPCFEEVFVSDKQRQADRWCNARKIQSGNKLINGFIRELHKLCYAPFCIT